jgi:hypothetical protein
MVRPTAVPLSNQELDDAYGNLQRLSAATARRVMRFWQSRQLNAQDAR